VPDAASEILTPNEPVPAIAYSRKNPFPGKMLVNRRLNPGSEKDTRHFEISFAGSGLSYEVGDSMAVYPTNDPELVEDILAALGAKGDERVPKNKEESTTLREALLRTCGITQTTPKLLKAIAERASAAPLLNELLDPKRKQDLDTFLWGMEVIDFLVDHPSVRFEPQEFVSLLPKLQPRL
jgi:sulfite reductase (NADPH) flavoprotein alpha-component